MPRHPAETVPLWKQMLAQYGPHLVDAAMLSDPVRPWTTSEYEAARDYMKQFSARRIRYVECAVAQLTGARPCN